MPQMAYTHILDEIFAERNARFELEGIHELRQEWDHYNDVLREVTEESIQLLNSEEIPNSKDAAIFWINLPDGKKTKLIQDVYMSEEIDQTTNTGKCTRKSSRYGMMGRFELYLKYAAAKQNDTTRTGKPIEEYDFAKWQEEFERRLEKKRLRIAVPAKAQEHGI